jgi:hypothetical protein
VGCCGGGWGSLSKSWVDQEEAIPDVKYPDANDEPDAAEAARERYDTLGAIGKQAAPEAIEPQLEDVMDVDGYLSWLAFNTLVRNGGTLLTTPSLGYTAGPRGRERRVCCVFHSLVHKANYTPPLHQCGAEPHTGLTLSRALWGRQVFPSSSGRDGANRSAP